MENDVRYQKMMERIKYRPYEQCANRVGVLMIIQQAVFQIGAIVVLFALLVMEGIGRRGFDIQRLYRMMSDTNNVVFVVYLASAIMQVVAGVCFLVFFVIYKRDIVQAPITGRKVSFALIIKCLLITIAVNAVITSSGFLMNRISGTKVNAGMTLADNEHAVGLFILVAVFPAIAEELFYRGVLFRYLRKGGFGYAAVISSLVFGMVHMNLTQFVFAGIMGFILCYLYEMTGHIWPGMLVHFSNNAIVLLLTPFQNGAVYRTCVYIAGVIALVALIILYVIRFRHINIGDRKAISKGISSIGMVFFLVIGFFVCLVQLLM